MSSPSTNWRQGPIKLLARSLRAGIIVVREVRIDRFRDCFGTSHSVLLGYEGLGRQPSMVFTRKLCRFCTGHENCGGTSELGFAQLYHWLCVCSGRYYLIDNDHWRKTFAYTLQAGEMHIDWIATAYKQRATMTTLLSPTSPGFSEQISALNNAMANPPIRPRMFGRTDVAPIADITFQELDALLDLGKGRGMTPFINLFKLLHLNDDAPRNHNVLLESRDSALLVFKQRHWRRMEGVKFMLMQCLGNWRLPSWTSQRCSRRTWMGNASGGS